MSKEMTKLAPEGEISERVTPSGSPWWTWYSTSPSTSAISRCASGLAEAIAASIHRRSASGTPAA